MHELNTIQPTQLPVVLNVVTSTIQLWIVPFVTGTIQVGHE